MNQPDYQSPLEFNLYNWVFPKIVGLPPKWMVKIMENPYLGVPIIFGNTHITMNHFFIFAFSF